MKKFLVLMLAAVLCIMAVACGSDDKGVSDVKTDAPQQNDEPEVEQVDPKEVVPGMLQGVWVEDSLDGLLTFYCFEGDKISTELVNKGKGGSDVLSGTFSVEDDRISYDFVGGTGYSKYTYVDGELNLTNAADSPMKKLTAADLMAYLAAEEQTANDAGIIILAEMVEKYFADSEESAVATQKKDAAKAAIKAKGEAALSTLDTTYDKVQQVTWYQSKTKPVYIDTNCYIYPYIGRMDSGEAWLRVMLNYTNDDWIFFNNVVFSIDGENSTRTISRSDITRDNEGGVVWETADYEPSSSDIEVLRKIASSTEAIIRFQGDEYYYDHVVTYNEKLAIVNVLDAYNYLSNYAE